jgi:hypothetical protein
LIEIPLLIRRVSRAITAALILGCFYEKSYKTLDKKVFFNENT